MSSYGFCRSGHVWNKTMVPCALMISSDGIVAKSIVFTARRRRSVLIKRFVFALGELCERRTVQTVNSCEGKNACLSSL